MAKIKYTPKEISIMRAALPIVEAVPAAQNDCWPGDGPNHDDHCEYPNHAQAEEAVAATEGLVWDFGGWTATARWFRDVLDASHAA